MLVSDRVEITYTMKNGDVHVSSMRPEKFMDTLNEYYKRNDKKLVIAVLTPNDIVDIDDKSTLISGTMIDADDISSVKWVRVLTDSSYYGWGFDGLPDHCFFEKGNLV